MPTKDGPTSSHLWRSETRTRVFLDSNVLFSGIHSPRGQTAQLLRAAISGNFEPVVSRLVLGELTQNLQRKSRAAGRLALLLRSMPLEVVPEAPNSDIAFWRDVGFGTDAPVIAAAIAAEVEFMCTGDRKLLRELPDYHPSFEVVSPRALLAVLDAGTARP